LLIAWLENQEPSVDGEAPLRHVLGGAVEILRDVELRLIEWSPPIGGTVKSRHTDEGES
jgi:hypothetical protein